MGVSRLTGTHSPERLKNCPNMNAVFRLLKIHEASLMCAFILSPSCLSFLIWRQHSCSPGPYHSTRLAGPAGASMMIFLFILTVGFIYEWKMGALDWE